MEWKFVGVVPDGRKLKIRGVNVWSQKWKATSETAYVNDPLYKKPFTFQVYTIINNGEVIKFAAGEFSNAMWGFYIMAEDKGENPFISWLILGILLILATVFIIWEIGIRFGC
jgi:hypothetical protein